MKRSKVLVSVVVLVVLSAGVSWGVFSFLVGSTTEAEEQPRDPGIRFAASIEETEDITGFRIASPDFVPQGFIKDERIVITERLSGSPPRVEGSTGTETWPIVTQTWLLPGESWLMLMQDERTTGIGGPHRGDSITINGLPGERLVTPALPPDRPFDMLDLFWNDGEYSYILAASLTGPLNEEILLQVAESVRLR